MPDHARIHSDVGRRQFLQRVLSGVAVGVAAQAGIELVSPPNLRAQSNLSPNAALHELLAATVGSPQIN